jgi:hypothetical protein
MECIVVGTVDLIEQLNGRVGAVWQSVGLWCATTATHATQRAGAANGRHRRPTSTLRLGVNLCVAFTFVGTGEFTSTDFTAEWLFTCMCSNMSCQVVTSRECSHTNSTLEWLLAGVNANMPRELIRSAESSITLLNGTFVRTILQWRLRRTLYHLAEMRSST